MTRIGALGQNNGAKCQGAFRPALVDCLQLKTTPAIRHRPPLEHESPNTKHMPQSNDNDDDPDNEEIAFWHHFIDWWEQKENRPATRRMHDALAYAQDKAKANRYRGDEVSATKPGPPNLSESEHKLH